MDSQTDFRLASGQPIARIGQGTWYIGDDPASRGQEIATLRAGIELGLSLVDTAEMYGGGRSEELVGEAIAPLRDEVFLVSKVLPSNASRTETVRACEESLQRLGTEWIDLYLLHWAGPHPLEETVEAFESLKARGLIGQWGVSNFDVVELHELPTPPSANQVLYNPASRGIEFDLLPAHAQAGEPIQTMAYCPLGQGELLQDPRLAQIAADLGVSTAQLLLAWSIRHPEVTALPKASSVEHVRQNAGAVELELDEATLQRIDKIYPAPERKVPLEVV